MAFLNVRFSKAPIARSAEAENPVGPEIEVDLATSIDAFAALAPDWNRLHDEAEAASVFNSWMWLFEWWRSFGAGRALRVLVARRAGRVVGVLPLYLDRTTALGIPLRVLRLVGTGGGSHPDDLGPVLAEAHEPVARALAHAALALPGIDLWLFSDIDPRSAFPAGVAAAAAARGIPSVRAGGEQIALTELPATWQGFLQSLGRDRRWRMRRARRRLAEHHAVRFFLWEHAATLDAAVERLAELHRSRWAAAGGASRSFASPAYLAFHRSVVKSFFARRWLRLYCLEVDGAIAAMLYCYRFRNRVYLMQSGFDPRLARLRVGSVLLGHAIEHAIGEGNEAFDFLRGEHRYKEELATAHRETVCLRALAWTVPALAYRLRRLWLPVLKARLLGRAPPALKP